jgi:hypothetical protein
VKGSVEERDNEGVFVLDILDARHRVVSTRIGREILVFEIQGVHIVPGLGGQIPAGDLDFASLADYETSLDNHEGLQLEAWRVNHLRHH